MASTTQSKGEVASSQPQSRLSWQPATGSRQQFCSNPKSMQHFFVSLFPFVFFSLLMQREGFRVRQPPVRGSSPTSWPNPRRPTMPMPTSTSTSVAFYNKIIEHQSIKISQVQHKLKDHDASYGAESKVTKVVTPHQYSNLPLRPCCEGMCVLDSILSVFALFAPFL